MDDFERETGGLPGRTRGQRIAIVVSGLIPLAAILVWSVIIALPLLREGGWARVNRGPRVPISATSVQATLLPYGIIFSTAFLVSAVGAVRWAWKAPVVLTAQFEPLGPRETTAWMGRPGWRGLPGNRLFLIALTLVAPCLFTLWVWSIWTNVQDTYAALFWTVLPIFLFFGSVVPGIVMGSDALREWMRDALGRIVITDRRIVWTAKGDAVYREICGGSLIGAALIEKRGARGWVSITQRAGDGVHEYDLFGLPDPDRALVAIEPLIALRRPAATSDEIASDRVDPSRPRE